jgi:hypothetical protein
VIAARKSGWRTSHEGRTASLDEWTTTLTIACKPLASKYVDERVVSPFWDEEKHTAARTLLNRIELTLSYAAAHGWRSGDNPASWKLFQHLTPKLPANGKQHHAAVPWREMPAFMEKLRRSSSSFPEPIPAVRSPTKAFTT